MPLKDSIPQPDNRNIMLKKILGLIFLSFAYNRFTLVFDPIKNLGKNKDRTNKFIIIYNFRY